MDSLAQVQVIFYSLNPIYSISSHPILVPAKLKRFGLSEIVNHLLDFETKIPFDFIVDGKFLRNSLQHYLDSKSISTENIIRLEFVEFLFPPKESSSLLHDDWVSCVEISESSMILTGSFDGSVSNWDYSGNLVHSWTAENAVKATTWLNSDSMLVGDSKQNIFLLKITANGLECSLRCSSHEGSINNLAVSSDRSKFASASWDSTIKIWSSAEEDDIQTETIIKKMGKRQKMTEESVKKELLTLTGHSGAVSSVLFDPNHQNLLFSGSWDHSVRVWDLELQSNLLTMNSEKIVSCIEYAPGLPALLTGHEDGIIRIWDTRAKDGTLLKNQLVSHKNWVTKIAQSSSDDNLFSSCSLDGEVKVWDIRSTVPLYTLTNSGKKLFALDWNDKYLVSGGEEVKIHLTN